MEFALVLVPALMLVFGIIHFSLLIYTVNQLNFATEATARCRAVGAVSGYAGAPCHDDASAQTYFASHYNGATASPTPSILKAGCGWQVTASTTYKVNAVAFIKDVALNSTSCFPA